VAEKSFADALNEQIANEFAASQQYIGAAVYYDSETLPQLASFFYRQAVEERNHAMIMVQYLLDAGEEVRIPDIKAQQTRYDDTVGPVKMALEQEERVTDEINALFKLARDASDFQAEQFLTWFVKEQVEEVSSMTDLLNVVQRAKDSPLLIEEFLSREKIGDQGADSSAPPAAGGGAAGCELAIGEQQDHHADHSPHQAAEVERLVVADTEQLGKDQEAEHRPGEAEQDGDEEASRVLAGHQRLADEAGEQPENQCTNHPVPFWR
jgi:bacterioferritin B